MEHVKFAADLGHLVATAKFAAQNPEFEQKTGVWSKLPDEQRQLLLSLSNLDNQLVTRLEGESK
jgi:hypothetical protein